MRTIFPRFALPFRSLPIEPAACFGREAPLVLEIGFGMGETTAAIRGRPIRSWTFSRSRYLEPESVHSRCA